MLSYLLVACIISWVEFSRISMALNLNCSAVVATDKTFQCGSVGMLQVADVQGTDNVVQVFYSLC